MVPNLSKNCTKIIQKAEDLNQRLQASLHEEGNVFQEASRNNASLKAENFDQEIQLGNAGFSIRTAHAEMTLQYDQSEQQSTVGAEGIRHGSSDPKLFQTNGGS